MRTILVHLNVEVADGDDRTAGEVSSFLEDALTVGLDDHSGGETLTVAFAFAEEI